MRRVVDKQSAAGVDVVNDGEQPRVGFQTYVAQRMKGFGGESKRPPPSDYKNFPAFAAQAASRAGKRSKVRNAAQAVADIVYDDLSAAEEEVRLFKSALGGLAKKPADAFMTSASPGIIATTLLNAYYDSHEAYVFAVAKQIAQGICADRQGLRPADRRARPGHGAHRAVPGQERARVPEDRRDARRGDQRGAGRHPARAGAAALLLGQLGRPACRRHPDGRDPAGALPGQGRRARRSSSPTRVISTNTRHSRRTSCPTSSCCCPA